MGIKHTIAGLAIVASAVGLAAAPAANAASYRVTETVMWRGAACIQVSHPGGDITAECGGTAQWQYRAWSGELVGVDPHMGAADVLACNVIVNGSMVAKSGAIAGDGNEVICAAVLP